MSCDPCAQVETLDFDSPLAKILDFLKRYSSAWAIGPLTLKGPSQGEAEELLLAISSHNGNLATPNIREQIEAAPELASDINKWDALNGSLRPSD